MTRLLRWSGLLGPALPSRAGANGEEGEGDAFYHALSSIPAGLWLALGFLFVVLLAAVIFLQWKK